MIRLGVAVSLLIAAAAGVAAQDIPVRSGEHDGYTRLVFNVPPNTGWALTQKKNGARLTVATDAARFQTGAVFNRLSANRLTSLTQSKSGAALEMEFGCDCSATAFLFKNTMIVVDIAPGTSLPPLATDLPPLSGQQDRNTEPQEALDALTGLDLPLVQKNKQDLKDQLLTRLLQGADREILDLNLAEVGPRRTVKPANRELDGGLGSNVRLTTVLDGLNDLLGGELEQLETKPACISDAKLDFANWAQDRPFPEQVSELRTGLFQEFDRLDDARVMSLAKLYAYFGFGAEAIRVLELSRTAPPDAGWIAAVAGVVDGRPRAGGSPFDGLQRCQGDAALWAVLAEGALAPEARINAIEQSFARLPDHLRRDLGPALSSILVDGQELEAARRVLRSVDRAGRQDHPSVSQAKAKVASAEGQDDRAETLLTEVVSASDAAIEAPLALARLVEKRWADGAGVSAQELELSAAFATELRRSELGPLMARTYAIALDLSHEFDTAFDLVRSFPKGADKTTVLNRHLQLLTERADDITFLRQTLKLPSDITKVLSTDTAIALSERFAALGFAELASTLADRNQDNVRRGDRAQLRARAALMKDRPHQAILELSDVESAEASILRARAMEKTGNFAAAGEMLQDIGDAEAAERFFWLAGMPDQISTNSEGKFARLTETTRALTALPESPAGKPLAHAESLLQDSIETRERIAEMFETLREE